MMHYVVANAPQHRPADLAHAPSADDDHRSLLLRRCRDDHLAWLRAALRAQRHVRHLSGEIDKRDKVKRVETMQVNVKCNIGGDGMVMVMTIMI